MSTISVYDLLIDRYGPCKLCHKYIITLSGSVVKGVEDHIVAQISSMLNGTVVCQICEKCICDKCYMKCDDCGDVICDDCPMNKLWTTSTTRSLCNKCTDYIQKLRNEMPYF